MKIKYKYIKNFLYQNKWALKITFLVLEFLDFLVFLRSERAPQIITFFLKIRVISEHWKGLENVVLICSRRYGLKVLVS